MVSDSNENNKPKQPMFEWDFDVPDTPFWKGLDFRVARNFLTCYEPNEIENIHFDATLTESQRLLFLLCQLQSRLTARQAAVAPEQLHNADPVIWQRLLLGIETLQKFLGFVEEEAETIRTMLSTMEGDARVPWQNMLADLDIRNGNFTEAESLARGVLPWMQTHDKLGVNSPQAFGTTRTLIRSLWGQGGGKKKEAEGLIKETSALVQGMATSKFAKYQDEERQMLVDLKAELETADG